MAEMNTSLFSAFVSEHFITHMGISNPLYTQQCTKKNVILLKTHHVYKQKHSTDNS